MCYGVKAFAAAVKNVDFMRVSEFVVITIRTMASALTAFERLLRALVFWLFVICSSSAFFWLHCPIWIAALHFLGAKFNAPIDHLSRKHFINPNASYSDLLLNNVKNPSVFCPPSGQTETGVL